MLRKTISAAALFLLAGMAQAAERPNMVLVMADDQGWGDMAYNGHPVLKTPNLDEAAAAGLRFDRFYAVAPVCSPTRASVLTGRHPNRAGVFQWGFPMRPQEITLPEALKTVGAGQELVLVRVLCCQRLTQFTQSNLCMQLASNHSGDARGACIANSLTRVEHIDRT